MTEENDAYWDSQWKNDLSDNYARSGLDPVTAASDAEMLFLAGVVGPPYLFGERTHQEWIAEYTNVITIADDYHDALDKILHPALMDLGPANFKMATAIQLVQKYQTAYPFSDNDPLGLNPYFNNYQRLAAALVDKTNDATAKLYGLMLKEGEAWYKSHGAYGSDWGALPQAYKDALLITYVNLGPKQITTRYQARTGIWGLPYEPGPGGGDAGGVNHLYNAAAIGSLLGLSDYAARTERVLLADAGRLAMENSDRGLAYRYALKNLNAFALIDRDYSSQNANGELDFYDLATGQGELTKEWLTDRAEFLKWHLETGIVDKTGALKQYAAYDAAGGPRIFQIYGNQGLSQQIALSTAGGGCSRSRAERRRARRAERPSQIPSPQRMPPSWGTSSNGTEKLGKPSTCLIRV
jgi:hypothetical protein